MNEINNQAQLVHRPWEIDEMLIFVNEFGDKLTSISKTKKKEKIVRVSRILRARGIQLGYVCYPTYRNEKSIEKLYYEAKKYLLTGEIVKIHTSLKECFDLYQNNKAEFDRRVSAIPPIQIESVDVKKPEAKDKKKRDKDNVILSAKIGQYGALFKLKDVLLRKADIIKQIRQNYSQISDFKLDKAETKSWATSLDELKQAYKQMDRAFGELDVVMEYVMPRHKPGSAKSESEHSIRADAIIVSSKTVIVLEFKQRDAKFEEGFVKQAGKYQTRLSRYHIGSKDIIIKSVLVLTKAENHLKTFGAVASCSADKLADALTLMFEPMPVPFFNILDWIQSGFNSRNQR